MAADVITTKDIENKTAEILLTLNSDPKLQELLAIYQKLPEREQNTMLLMIDAFTAGMKAQEAINNKKSAMA